MRRPNILIVMTDHQRGDTALPGHPTKTPNLDRLAREGVSFTEAYCPSPHCCPARATFFTGLYPSQHGVWNNVCNDQALSRGPGPEVRLWSEELQDAGYALHYTGKWHVSAEYSPRDCGWTEHGISAHADDHHGRHWDQYRDGATEPEKTKRGEAEILRPGYGTYRLYGTREKGNPHDEKATLTAEGLLPIIAEGVKPWCLYVGFTGPHDPYVVPPNYLDRYNLDDIPLPESYADDLADKPRIYQRMRRQIFGQLSEREVREGIRHFWAYCSYLDDLLGRILVRLDETGQADNTVVLYCSDHGDYCGEHGLFTKGIPCFRGAYHVPAVMRWPAGIRDPGRQVDHFVSLADFGPTILDFADQATDPDLVGASLFPFLENETPADWRDDMHSQCNGVELYYTQRSVMTREYKYTFNGFDLDELYNRKDDPHEIRNLADDPDYENVKRELCGRLWRFAERVGDTVINPYITVGLAPYGPGIVDE